MGPGPRLGKRVFFQGFSFLRVMCLLPSILKSEQIIFIPSGEGSRKAKGVLWLLRHLTSGKDVRQVEREELMSRLYPLNKRGAEISDSMGGMIEKFPGYRMLFNLLEDDHLVLFYKATLARVVPRHLLYSEMLHLQESESGEVISSPKDFWTHSLLSSIDEKGRPFPESPLLLRCVDLVVHAMSRLKWVLLLLVLPFYLFFRHLMNGAAGPVKAKYKVAFPVNYGVFKDSEAKVLANVRRFNDDMCLYGNFFSPGDVLHIFYEKRMKWTSAEDQESWKEAMNEKKIPFAEQRRFGVNAALLQISLRASWEGLKQLLWFFWPGPLYTEMWEATAKGLYHYLEKSYEMENTDYKVELAMDDYNPGHVIGTIVANHYGRKRVGVSHAASLYDTPQLCFVHFEKYIVHCDMYVNTFRDFWKSVPLEKVGRETIDSIVEETSRREVHRKEIERLYGKRKRVVSVLMPGIADNSLPGQWGKIFRALCEFQKEDLNYHLFLRFRKVAQARKRPHMSRFLSLPEKDPRIILDHENFNTHELIAASDLVITANASFGINEALVAGIPVFTFGYTKKEHLCFPDYGCDFIMTEVEDVLNTLRGLETGFSGFDCDWARLRRDADYYHDGKNRERLSRVVFEALRREPAEVAAHV